MRRSTHPALIPSERLRQRAPLPRGDLSGNINISTTAIGTDLNFPAVRNIQPELGTFFRQQDLDVAKPVVILGAKVRDDLFAPSETSIAIVTHDANVAARTKRIIRMVYGVIIEQEK